MEKIKETLDIYKNASQILATIFFRYLYEDDSIEPSDISFVWDGSFKEKFTKTELSEYSFNDLDVYEVKEVEEWNS